MKRSLVLSVVIITRNRRDLLTRTLETVFEQDFPPDAYEVIVVVDGATDGTIEMLRALKPPASLLVLEQSNSGAAAARNAGLRAARGELVLFLDDDVLCAPSLFRAHATAHANLSSGIVIGAVLTAAESPPSLAADWRRLSDRNGLVPWKGKLRWPDHLAVSCNCSVSRTTAFASGGFDERFKSRRDDLELGIRLQKAGGCFHYEPDAITYEVYNKSASDLLYSDGTCLGRNEILLSHTHPDYRSCSALARLDDGPWWRRLARRLAATAPVSPDFLFRAPYWLAERLRQLAGPRRAGVRLLEIRMAIEFYRSALREAGSFKSLRHEFGMRLPVLLYHRVGMPSSSEYPLLAVSPEKFERQLRWLARRGYVGIRASDWLAWCREGKPLPDRPVLLSFDDAYGDLAEYPLPMIKHYGFSATVFVVTAKLGGTNDWDRGQYRADFPLLTADQVRYWADQGIEFGAHTRNHRDLTTLSDANLADEIGGSGEDLKQLLGSPATCFAYPYGSYNQAAQAHVRRFFQSAFTVDEGFNDLSTDPHLLRRITIQPGDLGIDFAWRVRYGSVPLAQLRGWVRLRTRVKRAIGWLRPAHE